MPAYYCKLHPPRPDFALTLSPAERQIMLEHATYLRGFSTKGWLVAFGPVADPHGFFGVAIWQLPDGTELAPLLAGDPVIKAGSGARYETHLMPSLITRP
jgi:hypothetical protein